MATTAPPAISLHINKQDFQPKIVEDSIKAKAASGDLNPLTRPLSVPPAGSARDAETIKPFVVPSKGDTQAWAKDAVGVYEDVLRCVLYPIDQEDACGPKPDLLMRDNLAYLRRLVLGKDESAAEEAFSRALATCASHLALGLESRQKLLESDQLPDHQPSSFASEDAYHTWKDTQLKSIAATLDKLRNQRTAEDQLFITVEEAHDLLAKDEDTKSSDPYVKINVTGLEATPSKGVVGKTKVIKQNLHPVWKETFPFVVPPSAPGAHEVVFEVWDLDPKIDDFLGTTKLALKDIYSHPQVPRHYKLKLAGKEGGFFLKLVHNIGLQGNLGALAVTVTLKRSRVLPKGEAAGSAPGVDVAAGERRYLQFVRHLMASPEIYTVPEDLSWLLAEYRGRYGVSTLSHQLCVLEQVLSRFSLSRAYLQGLRHTLDGLLKEYGHRDCFPTAEENQRTKDMVGGLKAHLETLLACYQTGFPSSSGHADQPGSINEAVAVLDVIYQLTNKTPLPKDKLDKLVQQAVTNTFKTHIPAPGSAPGQDVAGLAHACRSASKQLDLDKAVYAAEFPATFNLVASKTRGFHLLIVERLNQIFFEPPAVSPDIFGLCYAVREFYTKHGGDIKDADRPDLDKYFSPFLPKWVESFGKQVRQQIDASVTAEKWKKIGSDTQGEVNLHSTSVVDLFSAFEQGKAFLQGIVLDVKGHVTTFAKSVCDLSEYYATSLKNISIEEMIKEADVVSDDEKALTTLFASGGLKIGAIDTSGIQITATTRLCVRMNDIYVTQQELISFLPTLDALGKPAASYGVTFQEVPRRIKNQVSELIDVLSGRMYKPLNTGTMLALFDPTNDTVAIDKRITPLLSYLNMEFEILSNNTYDFVFQRVMQSMWTNLASSLETIYFPESLRAENAKSIYTFGTPADEKNLAYAPAIAKLGSALIEQQLVPFFAGGGEGISTAAQDKALVVLRSGLPLYHLDTASLIGQYQALEDKEIKQNASSSSKNKGKETAQGETERTLRAVQVIPIISARTSTDEQARAFIESKEASARNRDLCNKFKLDSSKDAILAKHACTNTASLPLHMYITTLHVALTPAISAKILSEDVVIPIIDITDLHKSRTKILGQDNAIKIFTRTQGEHYYSGFSKRDDVYDQILRQAKVCGNTGLLEAAERSAKETKPADAGGLNINLGGLGSLNIPLPKASSSTPTPTPSAEAPAKATPVPAAPALSPEEKKAKEFEEEFSLDKGEKVLHKFDCILGAPGRMYVCDGHIVFKPSLIGKKEVFVYANVKSLEKKNTAMVFHDAILITLRDGAKHNFSGLTKRDETFALVSALVETKGKK